MAGGHMKYRTLSRDTAHRQALLRNLVTSLFEKEVISTTLPKAKEAQRLAEKLITLGKRNTEAARRRAHSIFYKPLELVPKLFGALRERYAERPGGYTRIVKTEPLKTDQAPSAMLALVDGPRDVRFAATAQTLARDALLGKPAHPLTALNVRKVTRFRPDGAAALQAAVDGWLDCERRGVRGRSAELVVQGTTAGKKEAYPKPRSVLLYPEAKGKKKDRQGGILNRYSARIA